MQTPSPQPAQPPPPNPANQPPALPPGTMLFNRYLIQGYINGGGFGHIYKALDTVLGYRRAIKEAFYQDPNTRRQFHLEAEFLLNTRHPNLVRGYLVFEQMGHLYLVMDYVDGHTLEEIAIDHIRRTGWTLPEARILEWMIPICGALHALHSSPVPIIHRDVKPANVKVTRQGVPILIDLGLAKLFARGTQTIGAALAFTPGYAPPEQYQASGATDARTDVYGMGASLFYLLTGYQPTEAPARLGAQSAPQLRQLNPAVSRLTGAAVLRAMELDPAQRQQSALALDYELRTALAALRPRSQPDLARVSAEAAPVTCARCGASNPPVAQHCMRCGNTLRPAPATADAEAAAAGQPATNGAGEPSATADGVTSGTGHATPLPEWLVSTPQGEPGANEPALPAPPQQSEPPSQPVGPAIPPAPPHAGAIPIPPHVSARPLFIDVVHGVVPPAEPPIAPPPAWQLVIPPPPTPPPVAAPDAPAALAPPAPAVPVPAAPAVPAALAVPAAGIAADTVTGATPPTPSSPATPLLSSSATSPAGAGRAHWQPSGLAAFVVGRPIPWQRAVPSLRRWHAETLSAAPPLDENEVRSGLAAVLALVLAVATLAAVQWRWSLLAALPALVLAHWCLANRKAPPLPEARWLATLALVIGYTWLALYTIGTLVMMLRAHP